MSVNVAEHAKKASKRKKVSSSVAESTESASKKIDYMKERDRTGKKRLTLKQKLKMLEEIYEGLLFNWKECVSKGLNKGTLAISTQLAQARTEITALNPVAQPSALKGPNTWMDIPGDDAASNSLSQVSSIAEA